MGSEGSWRGCWRRFWRGLRRRMFDFLLGRTEGNSRCFLPRSGWRVVHSHVDFLSLGGGCDSAASRVMGSRYTMVQYGMTQGLNAYMMVINPLIEHDECRFMSSTRESCPTHVVNFRLPSHGGQLRGPCIVENRRSFSTQSLLYPLA